MPPRSTTKKPAPNPLAALRVEIHVGRGDVSLKAEGTAESAPAIIAALVDVIETAARARDILPTVECVPGDRLEVWDDEDGYRRTRGAPRGIGFKGTAGA